MAKPSSIWPCRSTGQSKAFEHQADMPIVSTPEGIPSDRERWDALRKLRPELANMGGRWRWPIETRHIEWSDPFRPEGTSAVPARLGQSHGPGGRGPSDAAGVARLCVRYGFYGDPRCGLTRRRGLIRCRARVWTTRSGFMHHIDMSEWHLYENVSTWAGDARGYVRGSFYTETGRLVASTTQECLIRPRPTKNE